MKIEKRQIICGLAISLLCWLIVIPVFAETINNSLDNIVTTYSDNAQAWENALMGYAQSLFGILVLVDFAWLFIRLIISKFDFTDFWSEIIRQVFFIGFFYLLLQHSAEWANAIIQSFKIAGSAASTAAGGQAVLYPSDIFDCALEIVGTSFHSLQYFFSKPLESLAIVFSGILIVISFALIAALQIVALVESYIVTYASIIFMGFGGSHFTSGFATRTLQYAVSVGAKLFMVQLIVGLGQRMLTDWSAALANKGTAIEFMDMITIMGSAIVLLALTKIIPEIVQGMINGTSLGNGHALLTSASAAGNMAMAGIAATTAATAGAVGAATGNKALTSLAAGASDVAVGHAEDAYRNITGEPARFHGYHAVRADQHRQEQRDALVNAWRSEGYGDNSGNGKNAKETETNTASSSPTPPAPEKSETEKPEENNRPNLITSA